jgi:PKD repeat protein
VALTYTERQTLCGSQNLSILDVYGGKRTDVAPPVASFEATGEASDFTFAPSFGTRANYVDYVFDFGDPASGAGNSAQGHDVSYLPSSNAKEISHHFSQPGMYIVKLTVTDSAGRHSATQRQVVASSAPAPPAPEPEPGPEP